VPASATFGASLISATGSPCSAVCFSLAQNRGAAFCGHISLQGATDRVRSWPCPPEECRAHAEACERMAESLGPDNAGLRDTMREVAEQWRRLAADAEARRCNPLSR
jgi:hypothetical protein